MKNVAELMLQHQRTLLSRRYRSQCGVTQFILTSFCKNGPKVLRNKSGIYRFVCLTNFCHSIKVISSGVFGTKDTEVRNNQSCFFMCRSFVKSLKLRSLNRKFILRQNNKFSVDCTNLFGKPLNLHESQYGGQQYLHNSL